jgi:hypothetical protein
MKIIASLSITFDNPQLLIEQILRKKPSLKNVARKIIAYIIITAINIPNSSSILCIHFPSFTIKALPEWKRYFHFEPDNDFEIRCILQYMYWWIDGWMDGWMDGPQ